MLVEGKLVHECCNSTEFGVLSTWIWYKQDAHMLVEGKLVHVYCNSTEFGILSTWI